MSRAPFQVLVLPYRFTEAKIEYAIFRRISSGGGYWQGIAGGGECGETPLDTAKREAYEEACILPNAHFSALDAITSIPVIQITGFQWGDDVLVIPEYSFGVEITNQTIKISREHDEFRWLDYDAAISLLKWDSNKTALWELDFRINKNTLK